MLVVTYSLLLLLFHYTHSIPFGCHFCRLHCNLMLRDTTCTLITVRSICRPEHFSSRLVLTCFIVGAGFQYYMAPSQMSFKIYLRALILLHTATVLLNIKTFSSVELLLLITLCFSNTSQHVGDNGIYQIVTSSELFS